MEPTEQVKSAGIGEQAALVNRPSFAVDFIRDIIIGNPYTALMPTRYRALSPISFLLGAALYLPSPSFCQEILKVDLDPLLKLPDAYKLTPDDLPKLFPKGKWNKNPYFKYLRKDKTRAIFQNRNSETLKVELSILNGTVPVEELIIDFKGEKFLGITVSIYNRGDGGSIDSAEFERRLKLTGKHIGEALAIRPMRKEAKPKQGMLTSGYVWISARGKAVLEHNPEAPLRAEFLRMRLAVRNATGTYESATKTRAGANVKLSELPQNVKRKDGNVFVDHIPMVDQGSKGYCVVASVQRLFEYYGIPCDMHQLAQIAGADPRTGTSPITTNRELGAIDHLFKLRYSCLAVGHRGGLVELKDNRYVGDEVSEKSFHKMIHKNIDAGIPLLWSLGLGEFKEEPSISPQANGGHMRMIIGYNDAKQRIIFSDSWGAGHEFKSMDANDAYRATHGLFLMKPITR